jgi:abortive infection bacteriophage resistance protein
MKYTKPPLTLERQADLLLSRGMQGDKNLIVQRLASVNYYRLSGYWHPFRDSGDRFKPGTHFDEVWTRYAFDRRLRLLVIDAIERIEIAVRTLLAYEHAHSFGPFAYAEDAASLSRIDSAKRSAFLVHVVDESTRSKETFVCHFHTKYGDCHQYLPVWEATEIMAFGTLLTFFCGAPRGVTKAVASRFAIPDTVLQSWLFTLNTIRNICAHHGRLWNRTLGVRPVIPRLPSYADWHQPVPVLNDKMFGVLTLCRYCLTQVAPQSAWSSRFTSLLAEFPTVPVAEMGFPAGWERSPLWQ